MLCSAYVEAYVVNPLQFAAMETVRSTAAAQRFGNRNNLDLDYPDLDLGSTESHIRVGSVRIYLAKLKRREVIWSRSLRGPYLAKFDDPMTDGCQGTKDFLA